MKNCSRLVSAVALLWIFQLAGAAAMSQAQIPTKFNIPFGNSAGAPYIRNIPQTSQIGIQNCAASLTDGFPPLTFVPAAAGGCPPFGQDVNGILRQITQWNVWMQAVSGLPYDAAFSAAIGGYPKGAIVQSAVLQGRLWYSTVDNNTTNPDAATAVSGWTILPGTYSPGTPIPVFSSVAPPSNAVPANGLTVGNASSNATSRANADTFWLFSFLWTNCLNCTLYNSSGGVISKGPSAAADFAANSAIATFNMNGMALMGADSIAGTASTYLSNVPVTIGSRTFPGSVLGENLHTLTVAELASHTHSNGYNDPGHVHGDFLTDPSHIHANSLTDPGHNHIYQTNSGITQDGTATFRAMVSPVSANTSTATTGVTIGNASALTGITIHNASAFTGITIVNAAAGGGGAHNTVPRSAIVYWYLSL